MPTLIVSAKPARGRYRCGQHFTREPSIVEVDAGQEAAIRADSALVVHEPAPAAATSVPTTAEDEPKSRKGR